MSTKTIQKFFIFSLLLLFLFSPLSSKAARLSKDEFKPGESISIYGSGFGSRANEYSWVCFDSQDHCIDQYTFSSSNEYNWSDGQIDIKAGTNVSVDGEIIVYTEGQEEECYGGSYGDEYCYTQSFTEEKARLDYKIEPIIDQSELPSKAKPGETITIPGYGFGSSGKVYFGNNKADIENWSNKSVTVEIPSDIEGATKELRLHNRSGLKDTVNFTVFAGYTNDEYSYLQDYLTQIELKKAWEEADKGEKEEITVAVIDDGVYVNHPDLRNKIWRNSDEIEGNRKDDDNNGYVDDVLGYNFLDNNALMETKGQHGTMVASVIGAERNNNKGITGVAKNVNIMPVIISRQEEFASTQKIIEAIKYAVDNGADIINLSFGTKATIGYTDTFNEIMEYAYNNGVVIVAAAGNGDLEGGLGRNLNDIPESPVCNNQNKSIFLGVAALDNQDSKTQGKKKTEWSSYGKGCVNISAPGVDIVGGTPPIHSEIGGFYNYHSGTSFSAPIVAGIAALLKSQDPSLKNWEVINRIIYTADNIDEYNSGYEGQLGGRVNAYQALAAEKLSSELISVSPTIIEAGKEIKLKIKGYLSNLDLKLESQNYVMTFSEDQIEIEDPETLILDIPENAKPGEYSLVLKNGRNKIDELKDVLKVTESSQPEQNGSKEEKQEKIPEKGVEGVKKKRDKIKENKTDNPSNNDRKKFLTKEKEMVKNVDEELVKKLKGKILLQIEESGEGWYLNPENNKRHYLGKPADAFNLMRKLGIGISEKKYNLFDGKAPEELAGKILLRVEANGEAYYVNPEDLKMHYLGRPADAFQVMRELGLGVSNDNIRKIDVSS
jgi:subtilisin family serine protease